MLDRNGLRPSRYYVTKDGLVVMASEVGVLDIPPENVLIKERLHPGRIFLVDTRAGRIIDDAELKSRYTAAQPLPKVAGRKPGSAEQPARGSARAGAGPCDGARAPAGVRLHARGFASADGADGPEG